MDAPLLENPAHQRVLEWELTPAINRVPSTQAALAAELGVAPRTVRDWKERADFQAAWKQAFTEIAGSMERTKALLDQLYLDSTDAENDKRVSSAKLYFDIAKQIAPPEPDVAPSRRAQDLSDLELLEMVSDSALAELEARGCIVNLRAA